MKAKKITAIICVTAVVLTVLAGVLGSTNLSKGSYNSFSGVGTYSGSTDESVISGESALKNEAGIGKDLSAYSGVFQPSTCPVGERVITKTATLDMETKNYADFTKNLEAKVEKCQGYILNTQTYMSESGYSASTSKPSGNMVIKVPSDKLDSFLKYLESEGTICQKSVSRDDITSDYVETQSRLTTLKTEEETLLSLLLKATSVTDMITIEDKLTDIRSQQAYYSEMLTRMQSDVSYSTVNISLREVDRESNKDTGLWADIKEGFVDSLYSIGNGFRIMIVWLVSAIPFIAILAIFGILIAWLVKFIKNKKEKALKNNDMPNNENGSEECGGQTNN